MTSPNMHEATLDAQPRIPLELQAVFMASNQGQEVHQPPSTAFRVFSPLRWLSYPRNRMLKRKNKKLKQQQQQVTTPTAASPSGTPPTASTSRSSASLPEPLDLQGLLIPTTTGSSSSQEEHQNDERHLSPSSPIKTLEDVPSTSKAVRKPASLLRRMFQKRSTSSIRSSEVSETEHVSYS